MSKSLKLSLFSASCLNVVWTQIFLTFTRYTTLLLEFLMTLSMRFYAATASSICLSLWELQKQAKKAAPGSSSMAATKRAREATAVDRSPPAKAAAAAGRNFWWRRRGRFDASAPAIRPSLPWTWSSSAQLAHCCSLHCSSGIFRAPLLDRRINVQFRFAATHAPWQDLSQGHIIRWEIIVK